MMGTPARVHIAVLLHYKEPQRTRAPSLTRTRLRARAADALRRLRYAKIGCVQCFAVAVCTFSLVLSHRLDTLGMEREPTWPRVGFAAFVRLGWLLGTTRRVASIGAPRFLGPLFVASWWLYGS